MVICSGFWATPAWSQETPPREPGTGTLTVVITGFQNDRGDAKIGLSNSLEGYTNDDETLQQAALPIRKGKAEWVLTDLPWGKYSIKVYHDENGNGRLDRNGLGMPREAYGFSNNARGDFGPPDFSETLFKFKKAAMTIRITVR